MSEGLVETLVGVFVRHVLADDGDLDFSLGVLDRADDPLPVREVASGRREAECLQDERIETLRLQMKGDLVDRPHVLRGDDRLLGNVAEESELGLDVRGEVHLGAAQERLRLDADAAQFVHRVLRGLGLQLLSRLDEGHEGEVNEHRVVAPHVPSELTDGLEEGEALDVADGAADLDDEDVDALAAFAYRGLDLIGDMRDHLDGAAEVVAAPLLGDHLTVDLAGRDVGLPRRGHMGEPLVMAEVEVGFAAVLGDEHLAVLVRAHGARIHVQVGIALHQPHSEAVAFEEAADGRRGDPFAEGGDDAAGHENIFGWSGHRDGSLRQQVVEMEWGEIRERTRSRSSGVSTATEG